MQIGTTFHRDNIVQVYVSSILPLTRIDISQINGVVKELYHKNYFVLTGHQNITSHDLQIDGIDFTNSVKAMFPRDFAGKVNKFLCQNSNYQRSLIRQIFRSSSPEVFLGKGVLKICSKFTGEHPCRSAISIKLQSNFIEIALRHGCSPVNLLHIFRTPFHKNTSGWLLLDFTNLADKLRDYSPDNQPNITERSKSVTGLFGC